MLSDLLLVRDRTEIGKRFVIMNRPDVITPTISEVGATLDQEQQVMCSSRGNRSEECEGGSIEERFDHGLCG